jgi:glycosyltransferase involved in cell wall biosynthesis
MGVVRPLLEKHEDVVLFATLGEGEKVDLPRTHIFYIPQKHRLLPLTGMEQMKGLEKHLAEVQPDIIISNLYYTLYSYRAYRFAKRHNIPFVLTTEEKDRSTMLRKIFFYLWDKTLGKRMLAYSKYILAWSKDSQQFMQRIASYPERVRLLLAGIDPQQFYPCKKQDKEGEILKLLMVARMVPYKEHGTLLLALKELTERRVFFTLALLSKGRRDTEKEIKEKIALYGLKDCVTILEKVSHGKMREIYCQYDALVLPSRGEAIGMVALEAMACGLPVIVSDTSGAKDYVIEGKNGFLFKTGDVKDLVEKLLKLSENNVGVLGTYAATHMREQHTVEQAAETVYDIVKECL